MKGKTEFRKRKDNGRVFPIQKRKPYFNIIGSVRPRWAIKYRPIAPPKKSNKRPTIKSVNFIFFPSLSSGV